MHRRRRRPLKQNSMRASEVLSVAAGEVGYIGKKSNANLEDKTANVVGKYTKYARDLYEAGYYNGNKNGWDWCCVFVDWCIWVAAGQDKPLADSVKPIISLGAAVKFVIDDYKRNGRFASEPSVGAQVLYSGHTGFVEKFDETYIYTIEGNWSNQVMRRKVRRDDKDIVGYGLPNYTEETPMIFNRGDIVRIKPGVITNKNGDELAWFVTDGRPLYVCYSNEVTTAITIDESLKQVTAVMYTKDLYLSDQKEETGGGDITFINNEDTLDIIVEELKELRASIDERLSQIIEKLE